MPAFMGSGGAIFDIDEPKRPFAVERLTEALSKGDLAPVDGDVDAKQLADKLLGVEPEPKKPAAKKAASPAKGEE